MRNSRWMKKRLKSQPGSVSTDFEDRAGHRSNDPIQTVGTRAINICDRKFYSPYYWKESTLRGLDASRNAFYWPSIQCWRMSRRGSEATPTIQVVCLIGNSTTRTN